MQKRHLTNLASIGWVILAMTMGCGQEPVEEETTGNAELGIATFEVREEGDLTTILGLDARGDEVGRLELTHGRFALSPYFAADYATPEVDGRRLTVTVQGQRFNYETEGYAPLLAMPAHPASHWAVASFLDDPHVAPVLDRWQLGFEAFQGGDELAYGLTTGYSRGHNPVQCSSTSCGTVGPDPYFPTSGATINVCGGASPATEAWKITNYQSCDFTFPNRYLVAQWCGAASTPFFATKVCPFSAGAMTPCGSSTGACKACGQYNGTTYADIWPTTPGGSDGTGTVKHLNWEFFQ